jgi:energy-coupling factor transporter ATP-binding protein EcfA2
MTKIRNILLVGKTGSGKSTLANVLSESDNYFNESSGSVSETKEIKEKEFIVNGINYRIIDTVGFRDTSLGSTAQERNRFLGRFRNEISSYVSEGIYQILYVIDKRVTPDDVTDFKLLSSSLFDKRVFEYTTIVKTNFQSFSNTVECEKDAEKLITCIKDENISKVILEKRIVYVNNSSDDLRKESRKKLLTYLSDVNNRNGEQLCDYKIMATDGIMKRFSLLKSKLSKIVYSAGEKFLGLFNEEKSESGDESTGDLNELFELYTQIRQGNFVNKDLAKEEFELHRLTMEYKMLLNKSKKGKLDEFLRIHEKINQISLTEKNWRELTKEYEDGLEAIEEELEKPLGEERINRLKNINKRVARLKVFSGELSADEKFKLQLSISNYVAEVDLEKLSNKLDLLKDDKFYIDEGLSGETNQDVEESIHKKKSKLKDLKTSIGVEYDESSRALLEILLIAQEKAITNDDKSARQQKNKLKNQLMKKGGFNRLIEILKLNEEIIKAEVVK